MFVGTARISSELHHFILQVDMAKQIHFSIVGKLAKGKRKTPDSWPVEEWVTTEPLFGEHYKLCAMRDI